MVLRVKGLLKMKTKDMSVSQTYARMLYVNHPSLSLISRKVNYTDDAIMINNLYGIVQYETRLGKNEIAKKLRQSIDVGLVSVMRKNRGLKRWQTRLY